MGVGDIEAFSRELILQHFGETSCSEYLAEYLHHLHATHVLIESKYIDRHFLDDFVEFYSKSFTPPDACCERLHFFSDGVDIRGLLSRCHDSRSRREQTQRQLNQHYLGFVVKRPLKASASLGRTVLKTYPDNGARNYSVIRPYDVHLMGMKLQVNGLAYQQQDGGAAVCASTALWSAFQQVAHISGERTPTPAAVTRAARSPFPAIHGLDDQQMAQAISALGYAADLLTPGGNHALFCAQVTSFLRSKFPVILQLSSIGTQVGHSVTLSGHRRCKPGRVSMTGDANLDLDDQFTVVLAGANTEVLYVHDDNLGSHAHYELLPDNNGPQIGTALGLYRGMRNNGEREWWSPDKWVVDGALIPKPLKVRLPMSQLQLLLTDIYGRLSQLLREFRSPSGVVPLVGDVYYSSGVDVQERVVGDVFEPDSARGWHRTHALPRHVAVVEVAVLDGGGASRKTIEFLFDATTLEQHQDGALAVLCPNISAKSTMGTLASIVAVDYGARCIFGSSGT